MLIEIKNNCCNEDIRARDVNIKYAALKDNLVERDFVDEIEKDRNIGMVVKEM